MEAAVLARLASLLLLGATSGQPLNFKLDATVRQAVDRIATDGHLSVVATGDLSEHVHLVLRGVSAEEALGSLARAYHLGLEHEGNIWTVHPAAGASAGTPQMAPLGPLWPLPPPVAATPPAQAPTPDAADKEDTQEDEDGTADAAKEDSDDEDKLGDRVKKLGQSQAVTGHGIVGTGSVTVFEGSTVDEAVAYGGKLDVLGHVTGDAVAFGGDIHLGPKAVVDGDVTSFGGKVLKEDGAQIRGERVQLGGDGVMRAIEKSLNRQHHSWRHNSPWSPNPPTSWLPSLLIQFALDFALGFLFILFAPTRMKLIEGELLRDPIKCVLAGLLGVFAIGFLAVLLTVTVIGIPFALCLLLLTCIAIAMGLAAVAMEVGTRVPLFQGRKTQAAVLALGVVVLLLVSLIPVLGPVVLSILALFSLGAVIRTRLGSPLKGSPPPSTT